MNEKRVYTSTSVEFDWYSIEHNNGAWWVYGHGTYSRYSVLSGQYRRACLGVYSTEEEAKAEYPQAECGSVPYVPSVPDIPPPDFDPADCGESWDEI